MSFKQHTNSHKCTHACVRAWTHSHVHPFTLWFWSWTTELLIGWNLEWCIVVRLWSFWVMIRLLTCMNVETHIQVSCLMVEYCMLIPKSQIKEEYMSNCWLNLNNQGSITARLAAWAIILARDPSHHLNSKMEQTNPQ